MNVRRLGRLGVCIGLAWLVFHVPISAADPPADAFCVILIEPNADFTVLRISVDENTTLAERETLWPSVDLDGNEVISPTEKEAFRWSNTQVFGREGDLGIKAVTLLPNAPYTLSTIQKPLYATFWKQVGHTFHHQEYELPDRLTTSTELETQEVREFGFELEPGRSSRFTLSGGRNLTANLSAAPTYHDQPRPVIEYVVVRAPQGWIVERIEGRSYEGDFVLTPGNQEVDVPAFDTKSPHNITFLNRELDDGLGKIDGSPGLETMAVLVVLGLLVGLLGRR